MSSFSIAQAYSTAYAHFQSGEWPQAEALCRQILSVDASNADTLHLLGVVYNAEGKYKQGVKAFKSAIKSRKDVPYFYSNLALALQNMGETGEALQNYRKALALNPAIFEAHMNMGNIYKSQNRLQDALDSYSRALEIAPDNALVYYNLGQALQTSGHPEEAAAAYERAIELDDRLAEAYTNLGALYKDQSRLKEAAALHQYAIALKPALPEAYNNLAIVLAEGGQFLEAVELQQKALSLNPKMKEAYNNMAAVMGEAGNYEQAAAIYQQMIAADGDTADARAMAKQSARVSYNVGIGLKMRGELADAMGHYEKAVAQDPENVTYLSEYVHLLHHACAWDRVGELDRRLLKAVRKGVEGISPFITLTLDGSTPADHLQAARTYSRKIEVPDDYLFAHDRPRKPGKIRVGYLSCDFHAHPTAYLTAEMFERHNRDDFEIVAYSYGGPDASPMRERLVKAFDRFVDITDMSHQQAAQAIYDDNIDILVEMKGFTGYSRLQIAARRPAPVQVNFIGYPGTMGASFIDYIIADPFIAPMGQQKYYSEKIVQMPASYQPNDTARAVSSAAQSRAAQGLPEDAFVFCSFNNTYKITPAVFAAWMRLLTAVPNSVLWLLQANSMVRANLAAAAEKAGIDVARLVFAPPLPLAEHLARMALADLFIDTQPVNAHTTASDALWVGLPVLTCATDAFVGRVAGGLLRAVGLPELITHTMADYEALAIRLATDGHTLKALREKLVQTRLTSPLFDIKKYTADIEKSYREMLRQRESGGALAGFAVADIA